MTKITISSWMKDNNFNDMRITPRNTSVYGVSDMMACAEKAVVLYIDGQCSVYVDTVESFI